MTAADRGAGAAAPLRIEGDMTIYRAAELKQTLLLRLQESPALEVDLSGVTDFDSAGVQILLLAKRTALARQGELRLVGHSPAVLGVFEMLDLTTHFGDPLVMSPQPS